MNFEIELRMIQWVSNQEPYNKVEAGILGNNFDVVGLVGCHIKIWEWSSLTCSVRRTEWSSHGTVTWKRSQVQWISPPVNPHRDPHRCCDSCPVALFEVKDLNMERSWSLIAGLFTAPLAERSAEVPSPKFTTLCSRATCLQSLSCRKTLQWIAHFPPESLPHRAPRLYTLVTHLPSARMFISFEIRETLM